MKKLTLVLGLVFMASSAMANCFTFKAGHEPTVVIIRDVIVEKFKEVCLKVDGNSSLMTIETLSGMNFDVEGKLLNARDQSLYSFKSRSGNAAIDGIELTKTKALEGGKAVYTAKIKQNATLAGDVLVQASAIKK